MLTTQIMWLATSSASSAYDIAAIGQSIRNVSTLFASPFQQSQGLQSASYFYVLV